MFRLWQGYSPENSEGNNWSNYTTRPLGGYLDDLWIYTRIIDNSSSPGVDLRSYSGRWALIQPNQECPVGKSSANVFTCSALLPDARAGHASAFDSIRNRIWIYRGYSVDFPYLNSEGEGSGPGTSVNIGRVGFVPYPSFDYFKSNLWYYDLTAKVWIEESALTSPITMPAARMDAVMLFLGDVLFFNGGYGDNGKFL